VFFFFLLTLVSDHDSVALYIDPEDLQQSPVFKQQVAVAYRKSFAHDSLGLGRVVTSSICFFNASSIVRCRSQYQF